MPIDLTKTDGSLTIDEIQYQAYKAEYVSFSSEAKAAMNILLARIENLQLGMEAKRGRTLIEDVTNRIKTLDSCSEKLRRHNMELTPDNLRERILDMAGIRVITPFEDDCFIIADNLENQSGLTVRRKKDYISTPKENGYASLHLTIEVEVFFLNEKKTVPVEVQIRDTTMNAWGVVEHNCCYKHNGDQDPKAREYFHKAALKLQEFRRKAIQLRDYDTKKRKTTATATTTTAAPTPAVSAATED